MEKRTVYEREIVFDPETRDFAFYLDGVLVGFARTYQEAEATLDDLIYRRLQHKKGYSNAPPKEWSEV